MSKKWWGSFVRLETSTQTDSQNVLIGGKRTFPQEWRLPHGGAQGTGEPGSALRSAQASGSSTSHSHSRVFSDRRPQCPGAAPRLRASARGGHAAPSGSPVPGPVGRLCSRHWVSTKPTSDPMKAGRQERALAGTAARPCRWEHHVQGSPGRRPSPQKGQAPLQEPTPRTPAALCAPGTALGPVIWERLLRGPPTQISPRGSGGTGDSPRGRKSPCNSPRDVRVEQTRTRERVPRYLESHFQAFPRLFANQPVALSGACGGGGRHPARAAPELRDTRDSVPTPPQCHRGPHRQSRVPSL